jgi:plasmid stabilization system protein ParE
MPQVKYAPETHEDFQRFTHFLQEVAPEKISEAIDAIFEGLEILENTPFAGEEYPLAQVPEMRKIVISYGQSGYVALYTFDPQTDVVTIQAIRHQKEIELLFLHRLNS